LLFVAIFFFVEYFSGFVWIGMNVLGTDIKYQVLVLRQRLCDITLCGAFS